MHIFNVFITTVQGLKNVSQKVWEDLITRSRYPISRMHFMQPGQKLLNAMENIEYKWKFIEYKWKFIEYKWKI
jgi:hypothetical protein